MQASVIICAMCYAVKCIFLIRSIFKVIQIVIVFISINMTYTFTFFSWPDKRLQYQRMHALPLYLSHLNL